MSQIIEVLGDYLICLHSLIKLRVFHSFFLLLSLRFLTIAWNEFIFKVFFPFNIFFIGATLIPFMKNKIALKVHFATFIGKKKR